MVRKKQIVKLSLRGVLRGMTRLLPIAMFVVPFGIAFGIAAIEQGLGPFQATAMSFFVFTATAQFAGLEFLNEPIAFVSLGLVALALSGRHIIMGAALAKWVNQLPLSKRILALMFLSDANFADTQTLIKQGETDLGPLLGGGFILWLAWVSSTAIGAYAGNIFGDTDAYGVDVIMVCFFATTVFGITRKSSFLLVPVFVSMGVSYLTHSILPTGWNVIVAAIIGGFVALLQYDE